MHPSLHLVLEELSLKMKLTHRGRQSRENNQDCAGVLSKQHLNLTLSLDFSARHAIYLFPVQFALGFLFLATKHMLLDCFLERLLSIHWPLSYAVLIQSFLGKNNFKKEKDLPREVKRLIQRASIEGFYPIVLSQPGAQGLKLQAMYIGLFKCWASLSSLQYL